MLTTQASRDIAENVVQDVNANVMAPEAPRRATLSPEAALLFNKAVVARPLMVPEVCSIRVKNLEYRYRWVNKAGRNGAMYMQRKAQGFTNATTDDVEVLGGDATSSQGEICAGDVILMKIRADLYDAAIKYNMEKAHVLQRTRGMYLKGGSSDVNSDATAQRETIPTKSFHGMADAFIPQSGEIEAKLEASLKSGNDVAARKTVDGLRAPKVASVKEQEL